MGLVGCGPRQAVGPCSPSGVNSLRAPVAVAFVGQETEVDLLLPPAVFCEAGNPIATEVRTEVLSSENEPLVHTNSGPSSSQARGYSTVVTFTPSAAGVSELSARFEPGLGVARRQVQVVTDRTAEQPGLRASAAAVCDEVRGLTAHVVCRRGSTLSVLLPGDAGVVLSEAVSGFGTTGAVAWWWTETQVTRVEEVDGGLSRLDAPLVVGAGVTHVETGRLTRVSGTSGVEVREEDGGLISTAFTLSAGHDGGGLARKGDVLGYWNGAQVCTHTLAREDASVACLDVLGFTPLGAERDVLWLKGVETGLLARARITGPGVPLEVRLLDGQPALFTEVKQPLPTFTWNGRFVTVRPDTFTFDAFVSPSQTQRQFVTSEHVVFQRGGELLLLAR